MAVTLVKKSNGEKWKERERVEGARQEKWLLLLSPAGHPIKILQMFTADIEK